MALVTITRGTAAVQMKRKDVHTGMVFAVKNRDGKLLTSYAAIGENGRHYSVNTKTQELASSNNPEKAVSIVGKWKFQTDRTYRRGSRVGQAMQRSDVRPGEIFVVKGGHDEYAHLGRIDKDKNGWLSVPLARQQNHAVTRNGNSEVTVVGTFQIAATLTA